MAMSTIVMRPANLLRSSQVRAASPHTSNWGLARLSNGNRPLQALVTDNLSNRISAGSVSINQLHRFNPGVVGMAIASARNTDQVVALLATSNVGQYYFPIRLEGKQIVEKPVLEGQNITGITYEDSGHYYVTTSVPYQGFNLPFIKGMKDAASAFDWKALEEKIGETNNDFAWTLRFVDILYQGAEEKLRGMYPLPARTIEVKNNQ